MKPSGFLCVVLGVMAALAGCGDQVHQAAPTADQPAAEAKTFDKVRGPAVAGMFYPRHREDLAKAVDAYLAEAKPEPVRNVRGLICPHAGYEYSGLTAAFGYKLLAGRDIRTVIVLAPSHRAAFEGASIPDVDAYETPLGVIPLSPKAAELAKVKPFVVNPRCEVQRPPTWRRAPKDLPPFGEDTPHTWEHSLEVQLPFLQRTLKDFHLVPIVFGQNVDPEAVARELLKILDETTIVVASSDLSHYHPYETAKGLDSTCIKAICSLNVQWMQRQEACGKYPILTLMYIARQKNWKPKLLDYRNSGDTTGDKSQGVVGYATVAFSAARGAEPPGKSGEKSTGQPRSEQYTPAQRQFLLKLARKTVEDVVRRGRPPTPGGDGLAAELTEPRAAFVTLKKAGQLRGCIGSIFPRMPLYQGVISSAASAAVRDRRFPPVQPSELDEIEIEVSVLTIPERLDFRSPQELLDKLRPGVDGVVLQVGQKQSTYLPQVWGQLPEKEEFLSHLAEKAGLAPSDWKNPNATVLIYQVEAFSELEK